MQLVSLFFTRGLMENNKKGDSIMKTKIDPVEIIEAFQQGMTTGFMGGTCIVVMIYLAAEFVKRILRKFR